MRNTDAQKRFEELPDPDPQASWELEFQRQLFRVTADRIKSEFAPTTWQAFWQTAVEGIRAADVARDLGLSVGAVYVARSRVLARLTEEMKRIQEE